jgi:hypothetical protein
MVNRFSPSMQHSTIYFCSFFYILDIKSYKNKSVKTMPICDTVSKIIFTIMSYGYMGVNSNSKFPLPKISMCI